MCTVSWGVIGAGNHFDVRVAPSFRRAAGNWIVAIHDVDSGRAEAMARKHEIGRVCESYEQLLEDPAVEAVYVATPHVLHRQHVLQAAAAGKHVLCEKPLALTAEEGATIVAACRQAGVTLGVTFQARMHPAHREARRLVSEGKIGDVMWVKAEYTRLVPGSWSGWRADASMAGTGILSAAGIHPLDLVRYVTGQEIAEVSAFMDVIPDGRSVEYSVAVLARLDSGAFAQVGASRCFDTGTNELVLYGSRGRVSGIDTVGAILKGSLEVAVDGSTARTEYPDPDPITGLFAGTIEDFSTALAEGRPPAAAGEDGLAMARLAEAVVLSAREGRSIRLQGRPPADAETAPTLPAR